jgi:hypothetical protein
MDGEGGLQHRRAGVNNGSITHTGQFLPLYNAGRGRGRPRHITTAPFGKLRADSVPLNTPALANTGLGRGTRRQNTPALAKTGLRRGTRGLTPGYWR